MQLSFFFPGLILILSRILISIQSAPQHLNSELDEESLIDKLASLTAGPGLDVSSKNKLLDVDWDTLDYLTGTGGHDVKKPFGYRPTDPRFYYPKEILESPQSYIPHFKEGIQSINNNNPPPQQQQQPLQPLHMKKNEIDDDNGFESVSLPRESHIQRTIHEASGYNGPSYYSSSYDHPQDSNTTLYMILAAGGSAMGVLVLVGAGICWYRINERIKATAEVDYPAYGVTGPSQDGSPSGGDRKLAQSAHMYHYQHQKQQMAALKGSPLGTGGDGQGSAGASDLESDDENDEGDYTVYECPGLAPAGDMEVKNPLYQDEPTPATPSTLRCEEENDTPPPPPSSSSSSSTTQQPR